MRHGTLDPSLVVGGAEGSERTAWSGELLETLVSSLSERKRSSRTVTVAELGSSVGNLCGYES